MYNFLIKLLKYTFISTYKVTVEKLGYITKSEKLIYIVRSFIHNN